MDGVRAADGNPLLFYTRPPRSSAATKSGRGRRKAVVGVDEGPAAGRRGQIAWPGSLDAPGTARRHRHILGDQQRCLSCVKRRMQSRLPCRPRS